MKLTKKKTYNPIELDMCFKGNFLDEKNCLFSEEKNKKIYCVLLVRPGISVLLSQ